MLGAASYIVFGLLVHSIIGIGQFLVVLAPFWPVKIKKPFRQKQHFWISLFSTLSVIVYGLFPDLRQGVGLLSGYYVWAIAFLLLLSASTLKLYTKNRHKESQLVALAK